MLIYGSSTIGDRPMGTWLHDPLLGLHPGPVSRRRSMDLASQSVDLLSGRFHRISSRSTTWLGRRVYSSSTTVPTSASTTCSTSYRGPVVLVWHRLPGRGPVRYPPGDPFVFPVVLLRTQGRQILDHDFLVFVLRTHSLRSLDHFRTKGSGNRSRLHQGSFSPPYKTR